MQEPSWQQLITNTLHGAQSHRNSMPPILVSPLHQNNTTASRKPQYSPKMVCFFSSPNLKTSGGLFGMDLDGSNMEYMAFGGMLAAFAPNRMWGFHVVRWPDEQTVDATYQCEAGSNNIRKVLQNDLPVFAGSRAGTAGDVVNVLATDGLLNKPVDFAFALSTGTMYVSDQGNKKVKRISFETGMMTTVSTLIDETLGIIAYRNYVFVSLPAAKSVYRVRSIYGEAEVFINDRFLEHPQALTIDCVTREFYVADDVKNAVVQFNLETMTVTTLTIPGVQLNQPSGILITQGAYNAKKKTNDINLYVAGAGGQVVMVSMSTGGQGSFCAPVARTETVIPLITNPPPTTATPTPTPPPTTA
eukprot:PhF_6_TR7284/c0_g1_i1/m.10882